MSDYIERQKVKYIRFSGGINHDGFLYVPYKELVDGIKELPSADVVQVIHGKWTHKPDVHGVVYCSECDYELHINATSFCPNCGAKMDEQQKIPYKKPEIIKSTDLVSVIRCKDCKFRENDDFCTGRGFPYQLVPDDGFCDKGEREG